MCRGLDFKQECQDLKKDRLGTEMILTKRFLYQPHEKLKKLGVASTQITMKDCL